MKKISVLFVMLVACFATMYAGESSINRMVLKAANEFDEINVSGDITVEMRYNPKWAGYIVYHYDKNVNKNVRCHNEGCVLHVNGESEGIMSRIVIFYGNPLNAVVHNGDARLVSRKMVSNPAEFKIIVNGNGDVKLGNVKTDKAEFIINNNGGLYIRKVDIKNVDAVINGPGNLVMKENPQSLNVIKNGSGEVQTK
ncbi:MAG: DUF2807 domain-containing protein [Muribaculaceae bacterium]|nr:DUF2807 domain-containing protein [Muribaculaceae bacterium]MBR6639895.1 DUF2807 domain-containing protein [Muribaculaceae bacterium]